MEYGWQRFVKMCLITEANRVGMERRIAWIREKIEDKIVFSPELLSAEDLKGGERVHLSDDLPGSY